MFLENESELCVCRAIVFFGGISLRQPVWSFTDCHIFVKIFFSSIIDALINLARTFPLRMKEKIQQQQQQKQKKEKKEKKTESMDL